MDRGQLFSCLSLTELIFCCLIKAQLLCEMFFRMHFSTGNTSFSSQAFWKMFVLNCKERKKRGKKEPRVQTRDMPPIVRIIMMTILLLILKGNFFFFFLNSVCQRRTGLLNPLELLLKDCVFWIQANFIRQWLRISDEWGMFFYVFYPKQVLYKVDLVNFILNLTKITNGSK